MSFMFQSYCKQLNKGSYLYFPKNAKGELGSTHFGEFKTDYPDEINYHKHYSLDEATQLFISLNMEVLS